MGRRPRPGQGLPASVRGPRLPALPYISSCARGWGCLGGRFSPFQSLGVLRGPCAGRGVRALGSPPHLGLGCRRAWCQPRRNSGRLDFGLADRKSVPCREGSPLTPEHGGHRPDGGVSPAGVRSWTLESTQPPRCRLGGSRGLETRLRAIASDGGWPRWQHPLNQHPSGQARVSSDSLLTGRSRAPWFRASPGDVCVPKHSIIL